MQFAHNGYYKGSIPFGLKNFLKEIINNFIYLLFFPSIFFIVFTIISFISKLDKMVEQGLVSTLTHSSLRKRPFHPHFLSSFFILQSLSRGREKVKIVACAVKGEGIRMKDKRCWEWAGNKKKQIADLVKLVNTFLLRRNGIISLRVQVS